MEIIGNEKQSDQLKEGLRRFAEFINVDKVELVDCDYSLVDCDYSEELILHKGDSVFRIKAAGNRFDGGFFVYPDMVV